MPCRKLYYEDPLVSCFTAAVTGCTPREGGFAVTLDATAFFPGGGGQPGDTGALGGARVLSMEEDGEELYHLCDRPLAVGDTVEGRLDWEPRFAHMQQHTGEHILSGLIHDAYGFANSGFHMGAQRMEVDFDGYLTLEQLLPLERLANEAVWENRPLRCRTPDPEELAGLTYRTKRALPWPVRIVEVAGVDRCACCGVHVATTGQVGPIKILSATRFHGGVRVELVCGRQAMDYLWEVWDQNRRISQALSAQPLATAGAVEGLREALAQERLRGAQLQKQVFAATARAYRGQTLALHFAPDLTGAELRLLAEAISLEAAVAAVFSPSPAGLGYCLAAREADLRELGKRLTQALSGRGGGKPQFQQGTLRATEAQVRAFFGEDPEFC